jgi:hypothetical protein
MNINELKVDRVLCMQSVEGPDHIHHCNRDANHKGEVHFCDCGAVFICVNQANLDKLPGRIQ